MKAKKLKLLTYRMYILFLSSLIILPAKPKEREQVLNIEIVDERYLEDPNIRIENSYQIRDVSEMIEIVDDILEYKNDSWDRSKYSLLFEWTLHNICYDLNIFKENAKDVDFRQSEEKVYTLGLKNKLDKH